MMMLKINQIQKQLTEQKLDGWLLFDHHGSNKFVRELLNIGPETLLTRRFFYWIPKSGEPLKILHRIEGDSLEFLPGKKELYLSWNDLEQVLGRLLKENKRIAMEYSPRGANPYVSVVDAGIVELVRELGAVVVSSAELLQRFTSVLDEKQIESHLTAADVLIKTADRAWEFIASHLKQGKTITEYDVQQFICREFQAANCVTEGLPICAVRENTALPHYQPFKNQCKTIEKGDFILLDLWCKKSTPHAVFADITRVGVAASEPTLKQKEVFEIVQKAQTKATDFVFESFQKKKAIQGAVVDDVSRKVIVEAGYGKYFTHRTGHSIDTSVHGGGAHLDNFETQDTRQLLPGTCFSVEPGIYIPNEFGVRLEYDILIKHDFSVHITGGKQAKIHCLL